MASQMIIFVFLAVTCWNNCVSAASVVPLTGSSLVDSVNVDRFCCHFEEDTCGFTWAQGQDDWWRWSGDGTGKYPNSTLYPYFARSSNYMWSENDDEAVAMSWMLSDFQETTEFGFTYYAHIEGTSGSSALDVYFMPYNAPDRMVLLDMLDDTEEAWIHRTTDCVGKGCCTTYPCKGYIKVTARVSAPNVLFAFDDVEKDNGCTVRPVTTTTAKTPSTTTATTASPSAGCCEFTTNSCGFTNSATIQKGSWLWSGNGYVPDSTLFPLFPQGGDYLFTQNDDGAVTYSVEFVVKADTVFGVTYYAHIEDTSGSSSLLVYFINSDGSPNTLLDVLMDTNEKWQYRSMACTTTICCLSYPCTGRIRFVGKALAQNELYAIDEVEINGNCS